MIPCQHLRCPSPADGWAHLGRWRRFCCNHLAAAARSGATLAGPDYAPESEPPPEPRARQMEPDVPATSPAPVLPPLPRVRALPAPKVAPRSHAPQDAQERPQPPKRRHGAPVLLLPLREGRCRCCEQPPTPKCRGLCLGCYKRAHRWEVIADVGAPVSLEDARRGRLMPPPVVLPEQADGRCRCCERPSGPKLRGLCRGCYGRARRHGVLERVANPRRDSARFAACGGRSVEMYPWIEEVNHAR